MSKALPEYRHPPLIEVVCGLQFQPLELRTVHFGDFWKSVRADYPHAEDHPPLAALIEDAGEARLEVLPIIANLPPLRRVFFVDNTKRYLLQVGPNRFLANWRKIQDGDSYPRFDAAFTRLTAGWQKFVDYAKSESIGEPKLTQYELSYINHIIEADEELHPEQGNQLFSFFKWPGLDAELFEDHLRGTQLRFQCRLKKGMGVLHVSLQHGERIPDGKKTFVLELTARGKADSDGGNKESWFSFAHEAIVRTFSDVTTEQAQRRWERVR